MTQLFIRLFTKPPHDPQNPVFRSSCGKMAGTVGIACNALLFALKLLAGLLSGSVAVMADAVNNLSDASSSLVTLLGFKLAEKPADPHHPYGHARFEYLSGLIVAAMIFYIGIELVKSSVSKIIHYIHVFCHGCLPLAVIFFSRRLFFLMGAVPLYIFSIA